MPRRKGTVDSFPDISQILSLPDGRVLGLSTDNLVYEWKKGAWVIYVK